MTQFDTIIENAKGIIDAQNYTSAQIENITKPQLAAQLGLDENAFYWSGGNYGYFTAIRSRLAQDVLTKENKTIAQSIKGKLSLDELQWIVDNIKRVVEYLKDQVPEEQE